MIVINNNGKNEILFEKNDDANNSVSSINVSTLTSGSVFLNYVQTTITGDTKNKLMKLFKRDTLIESVIVSNGTKDILLNGCSVQWENTASNFLILGQLVWNKNNSSFNSENQNLKIRKIVFI